jgi:hypothetical protein
LRPEEPESGAVRDGTIARIQAAEPFRTSGDAGTIPQGTQTTRETTRPPAAAAKQEPLNSLLLLARSGSEICALCPRLR